MSDQLLITLATLAVGAISAIIGALWRKVEKLDERGDKLLQENGELRAQLIEMKDALDTERAARRRDRVGYERRLQRLHDENGILRSALRARGIPVEEPRREEDDALFEEEPI